MVKGPSRFEQPHEQPVILVVDDEPHIRELVTYALQYSGFRCVAAESVKRAIVLMRKMTIDLVITDLRMPEGSGTDLISAIRTLGKKTPVFLMTGDVNFVAEQDDLSGVDRVIFKPFTAGYLAGAVEKLFAIPATGASPSDLAPAVAPSP